MKRLMEPPGRMRITQNKATMYRMDPDSNTWATSTASYSVGYGTPRIGVDLSHLRDITIITLIAANTAATIVAVSPQDLTVTKCEDSVIRVPLLL